MRKLLLVNIGAAVACGVGAMGATIAVVHKVKADKAQSNNIQDVNNIFKQIQNLYAGQSDIKEITDSNYNSLYTFIQQSIAGTVASLEASTNKALQLQKDELKTQLTALEDALKNHSTLNDASFADIYTAIENLNTKLVGINELQDSFEHKLNTLFTDYQTATANLWAGIAGLQTNINNISNYNDIKFGDIYNALDVIDQKLLQADELRSMILSTQNDVISIKDRLTSIEAAMTASGNYTQAEIDAIKASITALTTSTANLETHVGNVESVIDQIWDKIGSFKADLVALQTKQSADAAEIAKLKTDFDAIKQEQDASKTDREEIVKALNEINTQIGHIFDGNAQLQSQIDYLNEQNNLLYQNFLYLQSAINNLEDLYGLNSSTTVSIKPDQTDSRFIIYDKSASNSNGIIRYPSIEVPNLERAKRFAIYVKVTNTSTKASYITQIVDAYPDYDYKLIGSSTQGFQNEQFLVSVGLDKNVDRININGLWMRKSSDAWKTSKDVDYTTVQITNVVVTY